MSKSYNQKQIELNSLFRTISLKPKYSSTQKLLLKHGKSSFLARGSFYSYWPVSDYLTASIRSGQRSQLVKLCLRMLSTLLASAPYICNYALVSTNCPELIHS